MKGSEEEFQKFIRNLTHDLREPVSKVLILSEFLSEKLRPTDEMDKEYLLRLHQAAGRIKAMTEALADYSKSSSAPAPLAGFKKLWDAKLLDLEPIAIPVTTASKIADLKKKVILLIDDDEEDYLLLRDLFKEHYPDAELRWCEDAEKALECLKPADPAVARPLIVLLDLNMPKLNGRDVLGRIRADEKLKQIPVVVLSNSMNKNEAMEAYLLGASSFIRKPAGYKELQSFVRTFYDYWFIYSTLL